jgi:hypothetical protein
MPNIYMQKSLDPVVTGYADFIRLWYGQNFETNLKAPSGQIGSV